jgi:hypothetical protein
VTELRDLARLAAAASSAAEARLQALRGQEAELRGLLRALEEGRRARAREALAPDLALRAGADLLWEQWVDRRRAALMAELARLLARVEMARDELRLAFGRRTAAEALAEGAAREGQRRRLAAEERAAERRMAEGARFT